MKHVHYRPVDGFFGDAIPFYWRGSYHVFYLKTTRKTGDRLIWSHIVSNDLVHWREMPDAILPGEKDAPDSGGCWTGSVVEKDGVFHAFYTGWNPSNRFPQTVCHAVSSDLVTWVKDERNPVLMPDERWYGGLTGETLSCSGILRRSSSSCWFAQPRRMGLWRSGGALGSLNPATWRNGSATRLSTRRIFAAP
ncbi:MAG: hypothetical protein QXU11_05215 [Thermoproteota archaeon]